MKTSPDHHDLWSQTYCGRAVDLLAPRAEQISWIDIAAHLASIPRFLGATQPKISVAQHSIRVAQEAHDFQWRMGRSAVLNGNAWTSPDQVRLYGLLHDAHEYILGDWTRPVVRSLAAVAEEMGPGRGAVVREAISTLKNRMDLVIFTKAGLTWPMPADAAEAVSWADDSVGATEHRDLMTDPPRPTCWPRPPLSRPAKGGWSPAEAEVRFLEALEAAGIDRTA